MNHRNRTKLALKQGRAISALWLESASPELAEIAKANLKKAQLVY